MRDWFAAFAHEKSSDDEKSWATWATRATPAKEPQKTAIPEPSTIVAQPGDSQATRATPKPAYSEDTASVAHVAQVLPKQATEQATPETVETCGFQGSVAHVARVAQQNDEGLRRPPGSGSTEFAPIPEPGPLALIGAALLGYGIYRRRKSA